MRVRPAWLGLALLSTNCRLLGDEGSSSGEAAPGPPPVVADEPGTGRVTALEGGTITTARGDRLVVPPGAVTSDVDVTITPLTLGTTDPNLDVFAWASFEPDGLRFAVPATLTLVLDGATPLEPGLELRLFSGSGASEEVGDTFVLHHVDGSGTTATGPIDGFSKKAVVKNCHAGTRDNLLAAKQGLPGWDLASLQSETGLTSEQLTTCDLREDPLERLLGSRFEECGNFAADVPVSAETRSRIDANVAAGRQVVFLFGPSITFDAAKGRHVGFGHSAVAAVDGGRTVIRNQIYITNPQTFAALEASGGTTTIDLPLDEIDAPKGTRDKRAGEVLLEVKGTPLTDDERAAKTQRPWAHVVVMCEKAAGPGPEECPPHEDLACPSAENPDQRCYGSDEYCEAGVCTRRCCFEFQEPCPQSVVIPNSTAEVGEGESVYCGCKPGFTATRDPCTSALTSCG